MAALTDSQQRTPTAEAVMAWARRLADGQVVHISMLTRADAGLPCGCVCAGCGERLEAVNPGRPKEHFQKPGTRRMSFRHYARPEHGECLLVASRLAWAHAAVSGQRLVVPRCTGSGTYVGRSGKVYAGNAPSNGELEELQITDLTWIDSHDVIVTVEGGRRVLVTIRAEIELAKGLDAVLSITSDDPTAAAMTPEEVLALAAGGPLWARWVHHWDQSRLDQVASDQARQAAVSAWDEVPEAVEGLGGADATFASPEFLSNLSSADRRETVLHLHLKKLLAAMERLLIAEQRIEVKWTPPAGGALLTDVVTMPHRLLLLKRARLEQHLGNIVPDVLLDVHDEEEMFGDTEVMVEIAVTHRVDSVKLAKIKSRGTPCLEIDATRIAMANQLTSERLADLLARPSDAVRWVYHPQLEALAADAKARLQRVHAERLAAAERTRAEERAKEAARERSAQARKAAEERRRRELRAFEQKLARLKPQQLLRNFAKDLVKLRPLPWVSVPETDELALYPKAFERAGRNYCNDKVFRDVVVLLQSVQADEGVRSMNPGREVDGLALVEHALSPEWLELRPFVPLLLRLVRAAGQPTGSEDRRRRLVEIARKVRESVDRGEMAYARSTVYDPALAVLFPDLRDMLSQDAPGTLQHAESVRDRRRREDAEKRARQQAEEARHIREQLDAALEPALKRHWTRGGGVPFAEWSRYQEVQRKSLEEIRLIRRAYEARELGQTVPDFVRSLDLISAVDVGRCLAVLSSVFLLA